MNRMTVQAYLIIVVIVLGVSMIASAVLTYKVKKAEYNQKVKIDISFEKMYESEVKIEEFFKKNQLDKKATILEIAKVLNVKKGGTEEGLTEQAVVRECNESGGKIVYFNPNLSENDKSFAFAHELAHLVNGDSVPATRPSGKNKAEIEQLADYTAAALLLPLESVYNTLEDRKYKKVSARKKLGIIRELCDTYKVSDVIVMRRIKEIYTIKQK